MSRYIIGVDGGGTNTLGVLFNDLGVELKRVVGEFANFSVNEAVSKTNIEKVINILVAEIKEQNSWLYIVLGIAGTSKLKKRDSYLNELKIKYQTTFIELVTDAKIALYSLKKNSGEPVILAIGGTGSSILSYDNELRSFGGYGHLLGDEGSAYHLVKEAFILTIKNYEEKNLITPFNQFILDIVGGSHNKIIAFFYGQTKKELASIAKLISIEAQNGSKEAVKLLKNEGKLLGQQIVSARNKISLEKEVIIGIRGAFIISSKYANLSLRRYLKNNLQNNYIFEESSLEPVVGCYYLFKEIYGG